MFQQLTPVLPVDAIEPVLRLWVDKLGFKVVAEVPHEDRLGFVILQRDGATVMYQTRDSLAADVPGLEATPAGGTLLFIRVDDIDWIEQAITGYDVVIPRRTTFYGSDEVGIREPGGHAVTFAQFAG